MLNYHPWDEENKVYGGRREREERPWAWWDMILIPVLYKTEAKR